MEVHNGSSSQDARERGSRCTKANAIKVLRTVFPVLTWLPRYRLHYIIPDILAGITVGLTAIPQGIAYAVLAGLPPQYGLYSSIMGCFIYFIFGTCKDVIVGPTAIMALMIQPHVLKMGPDIAVLAAFFTGCFVCLLGILQLGFLVDFISFPVVTGFTSAAAITIASSQIKGLFALPGNSNEFLKSWINLFENITKVKLGDSILSLCTILYLLLITYLGKLKCMQSNPLHSKIRNILAKLVFLLVLTKNAVAVLAGLLIAYIFSTYNMQPFKLTGTIVQGLPSITLPPFSTTFNNETYTFKDMVYELNTSIIFMPLVAILESIAIAKAFSKGKRLNATQEMIALGLCNFCGSFITSMSITGSFSRTALNNASGAKTSIGGIYIAITIFLALETLTSTFYFIPKASLSSVIVCALINMFQVEAIIFLWKTKKMELLLFLITLISSLFLGVEYGILIGIGCNLLFILYNAARPPFIFNVHEIDNEKVFVIQLGYKLHFPAADYILEKINSTHDNMTVVVDGANNDYMDTTVAKNICLLVEDSSIRQRKIVFWNFQDDVKSLLIKINPELEVFFKNDKLETAIQ